MPSATSRTSPNRPLRAAAGLTKPSFGGSMQTHAVLTPVERPTDTELIAGILSGDMGALETLMRLHNRTLYRTARAILRDDAEAEDAVQEAYLQAYRKLATFRGESKL